MENISADRRKFLSYFTTLVLTVIGFLVAIPALSYFWAPLRKKHHAEDSGDGFLDVGSLAEIPVGEWRLRSLEMAREDGWKKTKVRHSFWVRRQGADGKDISILSSICPHLGCPINWHPDHSQFVCPCHGGLFDVTGEQTGGPPPRSMDSLDFEVRQGRLFVRWQDFKIGVATRVPVNV
jgi:Rieske Fe-S protein